MLNISNKIKSHISILIFDPHVPLWLPSIVTLHIYSWPGDQDISWEGQDDIIKILSKPQLLPGRRILMQFDRDELRKCQCI